MLGLLLAVLDTPPPKHIVLLAGDESLRPVAVEVGLAPVVRRLGLRRAGTGMASSVIAWSDLQPASSLGVTNQLMSRPDALRRLRPHELATVISSVSVGSGAAVLQALAPEKAAAWRAPRTSSACSR